MTDQLRGLGEPPTWAPTTWAAHVLLADDQAWLSAGLLVATSAILSLGMQLAFAGLYQGGWERVRFSPAAPSNAKRWLNVGWRLPAPGLAHTPIGLIIQSFAFVLVLVAAWLTPAPLRLAAETA